MAGGPGQRKKLTTVALVAAGVVLSSCCGCFVLVMLVPVPPRAAVDEQAVAVAPSTETPIPEPVASPTQPEREATPPPAPSPQPATPAKAPTPAPPPAAPVAAAPSAPQREWYEGGTLHRGTVGDWRRATPENRLATCGDFATGLLAERANLITVRAYAFELRTCIDTAIVDLDPELDNQSIAEMASVCHILMQAEE